jgi:hypothetical protein
VSYTYLPIKVAIGLNVTVGNEAARLREDPGAYEVCYGVASADETTVIQVACIGIGDPVVLELPAIEAVHFSAKSDSSHEVVHVFVAWLQRHEVRVVTTSVPFRTPMSLTSVSHKEDDSEEEERAARPNLHALFVEDALARFERGFVAIPSLVPRERALNIAGYLDEHVSVHGDRYANMFNGESMGGWYISDCFQVPELAHLLDVVTSDRRLMDFLAAQLGGDFHLLERSEMYIGRHSGWHSDVLYGPLQQYEAHLDRTLYHDDRFWGPEANSNRTHAGRQIIGSNILTVAVYFRDHDTDFKGLTVIPNTHSNQTEWERAERLLRSDEHHTNQLKSEHVLTRAGDAVVFDSRLLHKGLDKADADFIRRPGTAHRSVLSISFGRRDAISEGMF